MLNKLKNRKQGGFTIIETLIVLAIAGLILIVVLLAVPGLKRNSRNTSLKDDVNNVAGGISTYESDNNGATPTSVTGTGSVSIGIGSSDPNVEKISLQGSTVVSTLSSAPTYTVGQGSSTKTATGTIEVWPGKDCSGATSSRAFQLWYVIETSGNTSEQCVTG